MAKHEHIVKHWFRRKPYMFKCCPNDFKCHSGSFTYTKKIKPFNNSQNPSFLQFIVCPLGNFKMGIMNEF